MAATKAQRIGIWIIAAFMLVGTIGSFVIIVIANENQARDQANLNQLQTDYQDKVNAQTKELSDTYFDTLNGYKDRVGTFNKDDVKELKKEDLKVGDGADLTSESSFTAYYIGWNPEGKTFDSSFNGEALKAPFTASPGGVIEGWTQGVDGMKVGGIRELSIPSALAYGEAGSGADIPPNTPLKFVIMVIPTPEPVEIPEKLLNYYQTGRL